MRATRGAWPANLRINTSQTCFGLTVCQSLVARLKIRKRILSEGSQSPSLGPGSPWGPELCRTSDGDTWRGKGSQAAGCRGAEMRMSWKITAFSIWTIKLLLHIWSHLHQFQSVGKIHKSPFVPSSFSRLTPSLECLLQGNLIAEWHQ